MKVFLFFLSFSLVSFSIAKDINKNCVDCGGSIDGTKPTIKKVADSFSRVIEKIDPLTSKWKLKEGGDFFNCPHYLEFDRKDNSRIEYTEYYGLKHRHNNLVRKTAMMFLGQDKLADRLYETNFANNVLSQKVEIKRTFKKVLEQQSSYRFNQENMTLKVDDRHFKVNYSCEYDKCKSLLCDS